MKTTIESLETRLLFARVPGIDVSHYQGTINWPTVAASGIKFAMTKGTEGTSYVDPTVATNTSNAQAAGVMIGVYHFAHPDTNTAAAEAAHFLSAAANYIKPGFLQPMLDLEDGSSIGKVALTQWANDWCNLVKNAIGVQPIIYCNSNYATNYLTSDITQWPLWVANYSSSYGDPTTTGQPPTGVWPSMTFWQYTSTGSVPGITGNVDRDVFNGPAANVAKFLIPQPAEITVLRGASNIADGQASAINFGSVAQGAAAPSITFTVRNDGGKALTLGAVNLPAGYTLTEGLSASIAGGASDTFTVRLDTATAGTKSGQISFTNNDGNENPFNFAVTGTITPAAVGGSIAGNVFNDTNGNGAKNADEGNLASRTVYIDLDNDLVLDANEKSTTTDSNGNYKLSNLSAGTYKVRQILPAGWSQTTPSNGYGISVTLSTNQNATSRNFGSRQAVATGSISGTVFNDLNNNGVRNAGENGIANRTIFIDLDNDKILDPNEKSTTTDASGNYTLSALVAGTYKVRTLQPSGWAQTTPANGFGINVTLISGQKATGKLFGSRKIA